MCAEKKEDVGNEATGAKGDKGDTGLEDYKVSKDSGFTRAKGDKVSQSSKGDSRCLRHYYFR